MPCLPGWIMPPLPPAICLQRCRAQAEVDRLQRPYESSCGVYKVIRDAYKRRISSYELLCYQVERGVSARFRKYLHRRGHTGARALAQ
jgi:hypothetical protein